MRELILHLHARWRAEKGQELVLRELDRNALFVNAHLCGPLMREIARFRSTTTYEAPAAAAAAERQ